MNSEQRERATKFQEENRIDRSLRPIYHATPPTGWMNDPNGFCIYKNKVHLFYQYHPYKDIWGPMHWGHCTSEDYLTWDDLPVALAPDEVYDASGCFSGSTIEKDGRQVIIYTGCAERDAGQSVQEADQQQCIATGDGIDYVKYEHNPVIPTMMLPAGYRVNEFRDPKVFEHDGSYWMVTAAMDEEGLGNILLFTSPDLIHWRFYSRVLHNDGKYGDMLECPDLIEIDGEHLLMVSSMHMKDAGPGFPEGYGVIVYKGQMDWESGEFRAEGVQPVDQGVDFYAPQSLLAPDGRRIMIGWMQAWNNFIKPSDQKWHGMMTIPRELSYKDGKLMQCPVRELERARVNPAELPSVVVEGDSPQTLPEIHGRSIELLMEPTRIEGGSLSITFAASDSSGITFTWDPDQHIVVCERLGWGMATEHTRDAFSRQTIYLGTEMDRPTFHFLVDTASVELFINEGEVVFSSTYYAPVTTDAVTFASSGSAEVSLVKYDIDPGAVHDTLRDAQVFS